jgi:hypothetical protein
MPVLQRNAVPGRGGRRSAGIHSVVRSSIGHLRRCRAESDGAVCTHHLSGRPPRVHNRSQLAAKRGLCRALAGDDCREAHCDSEPTSESHPRWYVLSDCQRGVSGRPHPVEERSRCPVRDPQTDARLEQLNRRHDDATPVSARPEFAHSCGCSANHRLRDIREHWPTTPLPPSQARRRSELPATDVGVQRRTARS